MGQLLKTRQRLGVLLFLGFFLATSIAIATIITTANGTVAFQLEGFDNLETINKQPGDLIKINLISSTQQEILFNAPNEFALLTGPCVPDTSGKIQLQAGDNKCVFAIEERTAQGNYFIIAGNATKKITVIASPETLYVTNSEKLKQRYNSDTEVNSLLLTAFNKANADSQKPGLVYDLAQFDNLEHPFATYPYVRNPTNPSNYQAANTYVTQAAQLIREKCGNCKNIILIGDDFVIPHFVVDYPEWKTTYGNFLVQQGTTQTNYLYTDQPFIPTTKLTFSNMGTLFSHETISFVLPAALMNSPAVNELKNALRTTFEAAILSDIDAASIQCNNAPLAAKTSNLIFIGNKNDNPGTKCFPWVEETSQTISLERNVWNDNTAGTKYAIVINSSDSSTTQGLAILIANNMLGNYQTTMIEKIDLLLNDLSFIPDLPGDIASIVHDCGHIGASWLNHNNNEEDSGLGFWCIADVAFVILPVASSKYAKIASGADDLAVARFGKKALQAKKALKEVEHTEEVIELTMRTIGNGVTKISGGVPERLAKLMKEFPNKQGDAVLIAMRKSKTWDDKAIKEAIEFAPNRELKNFKNDYILPSGKNADGFFTLNNKEYFVESTSVTEKLRSTTPIMESLETKSIKFEGLNKGDKTIVIKLNNGSNVPKIDIENQILYEYTSHPERMSLVDRVLVFDVTNNEVVLIKKPG